MGFQLTIAEGKEAGREFVFEQASVVIGRTSECDVVLYDPGVSRRHARILAEGDGYFVEDMGSSNGTKLNGELVTKAPLNDGDAVTLGPVVFNFSATELAAEEPAPTDEGAGSTRIVSVDAMKRQRGKGAALAPEGAGKEQLQKIGRTATQTMQAVSKPRASNPKVPAKTNGARGSGEALARPSRSAAAPVRAGGANASLSAAERARLRRDATSIGGKARLFWAEASEAKRTVVKGMGIALGVLLLSGTVYALVWKQSKGPKRAEPNELGGRPIEESFGLGTEDKPVDFTRPDEKTFTFEVNSASQVVVLAHFQCADISQGEVRIVANGLEVGTAPPDQMGSSERAHEVIIPPKAIKRGEVNRIVFDSVKNPPGEDPWRIYGLWIEVAGVPAGAPEDLQRQAQIAFKRGSQTLSRVEIGAANRYEAWRDFRTAWLTLEGHPDPKPELYNYARDKMRETQDMLDRKCSQLMLEFEGYVSQYNWPAARSTLEHVKQYFPGTDQPCRRMAESRREDWGL